MKPRAIENVFDHPETGKRFVIPYFRPLTRAEMILTVRRWIAEEKTILYNLWRQKPGNRQWTGNAEMKREELLAEDISQQEVILMGGGMVTLAIMEDFAARLLNESDSITVPMTVLRRRGVDLPELAALIAKYQLFPGKERRFAFENASPQRLLCEGCS